MDLMPIADVVTAPEREVVTILNLEDKNSVLNKCFSQLRKVLDTNRLSKIQKFLDMDEIELRNHIKLDPQLNRIRLSFWNEYYKSVDGKRKMQVGRVIGGICSVDKFHRLLWNDAKVAWILTPPADTVVALRETLAFGLDRIREILSLPLYKTESVKVGRDEFEDREVVDEKTANLMLKAVAMVDLRLHGSYVQVQKVEQKTVNYNQNVNTSTITNNSGPDLSQVGNVDERLAQLRAEVDLDQKKLAAPITVEEGKILKDNDIAIVGVTNREAVLDAVIENPDDLDL